MHYATSTEQEAFYGTELCPQFQGSRIAHNAWRSRVETSITLLTKVSVTTIHESVQQCLHLLTLLYGQHFSASTYQSMSIVVYGTLGIVPHNRNSSSEDPAATQKLQCQISSTRSLWATPSRCIKLQTKINQDLLRPQLQCLWATLFSTPDFGVVKQGVNFPTNNKWGNLDLQWVLMTC